MEDFWSLNEHVFICLYDPKRTLAFKRAIRKTVRSGDVVVDLGAGSGILSLFAADAGAKRVYAVESDQVSIAGLKKTVELNGARSVINVISGDATCIDLPESVDVIICEMIASGLVEESQVPVMNNAHRFAKPKCRVLVAKYDIGMDLVNHRNTFHGKVFHCPRFEFPDKPSLRSVALSPRKTLRQVDFTAPLANTVIDDTLRFQTTRSGVVNGVRLSGKTTFADGSTFGHSIAYSFPMILPVTPPLAVASGTNVEVAIKYTLCGGADTLSYEVREF